MQQSPIVDIAMASGFSSASHFSKAYRDFYGHSPHRARKGAGIRKNEPDGITPSRRKGTS
ncbi:helix-turn-helix domain-containing protein [Paracoccus versutus]|uniref:helix-turn-helix domain-containing protein n=1 Tax=Paracoccus versutus TaxID=34007 RepID=UPI003C7D0D19